MRIPLVDLSRQHAEIEQTVMAGLEAVMSRTSFILGEEVTSFEQAFAGFCGVEHCIGVASGTDALELAVRSLDIGPGDEVIVPANSFIASALAVLRAGARVVLADCSLDTYLIDPDQLESRITSRTRAIIPVHLFGQMAPVERIEALAPGVPIIEDGAQSQGATRHGQPAGSVGVIAGTSFYPGKNIGAYGDAGAVLTSDPALADRVRAMANWGSPEKYHHPVVGFNSRLDTMQAVVLLAKLERLERWNKERAAAAEVYTHQLQEEEAVVLPVTEEGNTHVWHLYVIRAPDRDRALASLHAEGIGAGIHYPVPMHLQGALASLGHQPGDFPATERAAAEMISLPIFPGITESEQTFVVEALFRALRRGS